MRQPEGHDIVALEAVRHAAREYGIPAGYLKPCIALLLMGELGSANRRHCALTIGIELRGQGRSENEVRAILMRWRRKTGLEPRSIDGAIRGAFKRRPNGSFAYHPPGLRKTSPVYKYVLAPTCEAVGCPMNCPPLRALHRGPRGEDLGRFRELAWPKILRSRRQHAAVAVYEALAVLETRRGIAAGGPLITSYKQVAELAGVDCKTVGRTLRTLEAIGLVIFEPGSGDGPRARNRKGSIVTRVVPIPRPEPFNRPAFNCGGRGAIHIEGGRPPRCSDGDHLVPSPSLEKGEAR